MMGKHNGFACLLRRICSKSPLREGTRFGQGPWIRDLKCISTTSGHLVLDSKKSAWRRTQAATQQLALCRSYSMPTNRLHYTGKDIKQASLEKGGKILRLVWTDELETKFHSLWLRYNCRCSSCRHESSNQRIFDVSTVPEVNLIKDVKVTDDGNVLLNWHGDDHSGHIRLEFLRANRYDEEALKQRYEDTNIITFSKDKTVPSITYDEVVNSELGIYNWLNQIAEHGLSLLKGVPAEKGFMKKVVQQIGPIQTTTYGELYDVVLEVEPTNVAYSTESLLFHMDQQMYESPPGIQFLHCIRFDETVKGGETLFVDMYQIAEELKQNFPVEYKTLCRVPVTFERIHSSRDHPVYFVVQRPHFTENSRGQIVDVHWHPNMEGPLFVKEEDIDAYYRGYQLLAKMVQNSPYIKPVRLQPGDMICFNNHRMAHGRNAFEQTSGGKRFLQGCYVNIDDFRSTLNVLSTTLGDGKLSKKVGNFSWF